jgi:hypothetical protein
MFYKLNYTHYILQLILKKWYYRVGVRKIKNQEIKTGDRKTDIKTDITTERDRETEIQRDRETEIQRQRQRQRERQRDRETERQNHEIKSLIFVQIKSLKIYRNIFQEIITL